MSDIIFGIDFGTTNSALAVNVNGNVEVIDVDQFNTGGNTLKSVLYFDPEEKKFFVGQEAINNYIENDAYGRFMQSIKASGRDIKIRAGVDMLHRMHKAPGGLIRAEYAVVDGCFEALHFSGDFFCYPSNTIEGLETSLNGQPVADAGKLVQAFYAQGEFEVPGVEVEDWLAVLAVKI
jgi:hypothetical protein